MDQLYSKKGGNGFWFFPTPKVVGHNRVPSKHSYYWITEPLMRYHLKKLSGCYFFEKIIRHLIIWKTLHFKALTQIWLSKVKVPALLKERWRRLTFFNPKSCWAQKSSIQTFILLSNWATHEVPPWKMVWMLLFFLKGFKKASNYLENLAF